MFAGPQAKAPGCLSDGGLCNFAAAAGLFRPANAFARLEATGSWAAIVVLVVEVVMVGTVERGLLLRPALLLPFALLTPVFTFLVCRCVDLEIIWRPI